MLEDVVHIAPARPARRAIPVLEEDLGILRPLLKLQRDQEVDVNLDLEQRMIGLDS